MKTGNEVGTGEPVRNEGRLPKKEARGGRESTNRRFGVELTLRIEAPNGKSPGLEMMTGAPNQRGDRRDDHRNWSVAREVGFSQEEAP